MIEAILEMLEDFFERFSNVDRVVGRLQKDSDKLSNLATKHSTRATTLEDKSRVVADKAAAQRAESKRAKNIADNFSKLIEG